MSTAETAEGQDVETGKLFEVPRVAIAIDESDPTVLKVAFSGSIELERGDPDAVKFYNTLAPGENTSLNIEAFIAGPKNTHRRDSEGFVDAVVQTKSLVVHSIDHL